MNKQERELPCMVGRVLILPDVPPCPHPSAGGEVMVEVAGMFALKVAFPACQGHIDLFTVRAREVAECETTRTRTQ